MQKRFRTAAIIAAVSGLLAFPGFPSNTISAAGSQGVGDGEEILGRVAFHSMRDGNAEIYTMNVNGSHPERVTEHPSADTDPAISPDGRDMVFTSNRSGNNDIYLLSSVGGTPVNLTMNPANDGWARWSPDGLQIAFHSNRDGGDFEIYVMDLGTGLTTRLTNHDGIDQFPDWSPDGNRIVFRRNTNIYALDLTTGETVQLTDSAGFNQMATWSPDGTQIVFMSTRDGYPSVFTMDADGEHQINRTPKGAADLASDWMSRAPSWSRNGKRIYFTSFRPSTGGDTEVFVMEADGSRVRRLTFVIGVDASARAR